MDGIINLHKPTGITSAKALYRVRSLTGERKSGHGGTLDPAASGVLLLCLGRATKLVERIMDQPKVYRATARLDVTSESFDCDRPLVPVALNRYGDRDQVSQYRLPRLVEFNQYRDRQGADLGGELHEAPVAHRTETTGRHAERSEISPAPERTSESVQHYPTPDEVLAALRHFEGEIQQVPPAISAVKIAGQPAYKRKAADAPLQLKPRPIHIYWIHLHSYDWPMIDFEICCGRGTYVRALIRDLGRRLETGGCLTSLARTRIGPFKIEDSWTMEAIAEKSPAPRVKSTIDSSTPERASAREPLPLLGGGQGGGEAPRPSTVFHSPPYVIPLDEAVRLLSPDAVLIPPRP